MPSLKISKKSFPKHTKTSTANNRLNPEVQARHQKQGQMNDVLQFLVSLFSAKEPTAEEKEMILELFVTAWQN